jgi:hypothetical protein
MEFYVMVIDEFMTQSIIILMVLTMLYSKINYCLYTFSNYKPSIQEACSIFNEL